MSASDKIFAKESISVLRSSMITFPPFKKVVGLGFLLVFSTFVFTRTFGEVSEPSRYSIVKGTEKKESHQTKGTDCQVIESEESETEAEGIEFCSITVSWASGLHEIFNTVSGLISTPRIWRSFIYTDPVFVLTCSFRI